MQPPTELSLPERLRKFKYSYLTASVADMLTANHEYIEKNSEILKKGLGLLDSIVSGYEFLFEKGHTTQARENVQLLNWYMRSNPEIPENDPEFGDRYKKYIQEIRNDLTKIIENPAATPLETYNKVRVAFADLSDFLHSEFAGQIS